MTCYIFSIFFLVLITETLDNDLKYPKPTIMKPYLNLPKLVPFLLFTLFSQMGISQNIAINTDGSSPDVSAMLDIVSSNKGLLMPRVSLSSTTDVATIATPATGLLVYNSNAGITGTGAAGVGFYYNAGTTTVAAWTKLATSTSTSWNTAGNAATDSASNFIGTTDAKSLMIKTNNTRRMNISSVGVTTVGDGTNQVKIDPAGHLSLEGTATNFNDIQVTPVSTYKEGTNAPSFLTFKGSLQALTFTNAGTDQQVFFSIQMPHNWKEGSTIYPHIHWSPQSSTTGVVVWGFEYSWVNYDATTPIAFPNSVTLSQASSAIASGDNDKHLITAFSSITPDGTQGKISSILMCRLFRNSSNASDTYNGSAALLSFDIHYEMDGIGSNSQYVK
jgi:hypothetical protein